MRRRHVGTGARPAGAPLPRRGARRPRARRVGSALPISTSDTLRRMAHRRCRAHRPRASDGRRPLAHRHPRRPARRRAATRAIERLVVYAAPGVGPYRMPLRLRYVAIRFAIRPSARNAERFDRFALLDLDATRERDPEWYDAFVAYTRSRAREPARQEDDAPAHRERGQAHPRGRARPHRRSHHAVVGTPRPHGPARDRRGRRITPRLAVARHRRRRPRPPHRTTRCIRGRAHRPPCLCLELRCHALRRGRAERAHSLLTRRAPATVQ